MRSVHDSLIQSHVRDFGSGPNVSSTLRGMSRLRVPRSLSAPLSLGLSIALVGASLTTVAIRDVASAPRPRPPNASASSPASTRVRGP